MVMDKFIMALLSVLGITLFSCNFDIPKNIEPIVTFQYFNFSGEDVFADTVNTYLSINRIDENVIFEYNGRYKETFCINFPEHKGYKILRNDTTDLQYIEKYRIVMHPQNDSLDIYKFISNQLSVDGMHYLFFSPQLGIVLKKSTTWPTFSELSEHFLVQKNAMINQLTSILLFKEYLEVVLKVPMEEPPLPP
jgi:hypothetical protein